jgi:hypothetical protein
MRLKLRRYRRGAASLGATVGATLIGLALAVPAGASTVAAGNTVLNQGGSQTDYNMMQQLSDLYNSSPGCQLLTASSSNQELNYECAGTYSTAAPGEEEGYNLVTTSGASYSPLNPYNDVVYQEAPLGSSNGIKALELQGADTPGSPPNNEIAANDIARSSRAASISATGDKSGLNFVSYAADAVPWFHFTKSVGTGGDSCAKSPSAKIKSISNSDLTGIYEGTITNWDQIPAKTAGTFGKNAPIDVYIAQSGSGTESTWATDLGITGTYPFGGVTATAARLSLPASDFEIFENETSDIWKNPAKDSCDAIFFFSYGKYTLLCPSGNCADTPPANAGSVSALGQINGVSANETTIEDQFTDPSGAFYTDRQLYNVYVDGSNCNLPFENTPANCSTPEENTGTLPPFVNQAVQAFVSPYGFLCNPAEYSEIDPISPTELTYGQEIDSVIEANGFFPEPEGVMGDASIPTPPDPTQSGYDANYAAAEPVPSGDKGYCRVTSTDGDGNT